MTENLPERRGSLRERREGLIEALTVHFANDRIDAEEFEARVDRAYKALSVQELDAIRADLPALPLGTPGALPTVHTASPEEVRRSQVVAAVLGGTERKGTWVPAKRITALAVMGGVVLDLREARMSRGLTEINVFALMGGIEILVPPGLRVQCEGIGILGGFEGLDQPGVSSEPDQPTLRITGLAIMGGVEITERRPGESAKDKKRRLREEKRERRRLPEGR